MARRPVIFKITLSFKEAACLEAALSLLEPEILDDFPVRLRAQVRRAINRALAKYGAMIELDF